jgi:acetyl-CoA decarbonylase/synthase complex subunit gamma
MALTGLEIFKLLPKTNCGDCGVPTCLAFAMKLAQKKAELSECPHASEEAKNILGAASEPPMKLLKIGSGAEAFEIGGETEMFRHQKTFYHQTAFMIKISDTEDIEAIAIKVKEVDTYLIERAGEQLHLDGFCLSNQSGNKQQFLDTLKVVIGNSSKAVILDSNNFDTVKEALTLLNGKRPVIYPQDADALELDEIAKETGASLIVSAETFDELSAKAEKVLEIGLKDIILQCKSKNPWEQLQNNTIIRRAALKKRFKPFGFPQAWFLEPMDDFSLLANAVIGVCKYSGILVLPSFNKEMMLTLLTLRQNIYTDPQKPIQMDAKLYAIGEPKADSPVFVTTNFSLTYFIVSSEIENSGISAWLVVPDCEGMSVLTAWAAGKFSGASVGKFVKELKLEERVSTREIIIPGYVATISGDLEEALPNWKIVVGPQEAGDIAPFVKNYLKI